MTHPESMEDIVKERKRMEETSSRGFPQPKISRTGPTEKEQQEEKKRPETAEPGESSPTTQARFHKVKRLSSPGGAGKMNVEQELGMGYKLTDDDESYGDEFSFDEDSELFDFLGN